MIPPKLDGRSREQLRAQTELAARTYTEGQWAPARGATDPGLALIEVFALFARHLVQRVDAAPAMHRAAFLELAGIPHNPARSARAPVTVVPTEGQAPSLPAGARFTTQATDAAGQPVAFELERALTAHGVGFQGLHTADEVARAEERAAQASAPKPQPSSGPPQSIRYNGTPITQDAGDIMPFGVAPSVGDVTAFRFDGLEGATLFGLDVVAAEGAKAGGASVCWQAWTGEWTDVTPWATPKALESNAAMSFASKKPLTRCKVNGEDGVWLRVRIQEWAYYQGPEVKYKDVTIGGVTFQIVDTITPGVSAPPRLQSLKFTVHDGPSVAKPSVPEHTDDDGSDRPAHLYLAFDRPFEDLPVCLFLVPEGSRAGLHPTWEYSQEGGGWGALKVEDGTLGLSCMGELRFLGPRDAERRSLGGESRFWLRVSLALTRDEAPPALSVYPDTAWARHQQTTPTFTLGSSDGSKAQTFSVPGAPVLPATTLQVAEPLEDREHPGQTERSVWVPWTRQVHLQASGPDDRHYVLDGARGVVTFGDGTNGRIPRAGLDNIRLAPMVLGGGVAGNLGAKEIAGLGGRFDGVASVHNPRPATGGVAPEDDEAWAERAPTWLRHRERAVHCEDYADLAQEADHRVGRAVVVMDTPILDFDPLSEQPDRREDWTVEVLVIARDPFGPSEDLLTNVQQALQRAAPLGCAVQVSAPALAPCAVTARLIATDPADGTLPERAAAALRGFLNPVSGGADGRGWPPGTWPDPSDLYLALYAVPGVDDVLSMDASPPVADRRTVVVPGKLSISLEDA